MPNWGAIGTGLGALAGGAGGFMLGGPAGAMAGAQLGGAAGAALGGGFNEPRRGAYQLPYFQEQYGQYGDIAGQAAGRQAPQMGVSGFRGGQEQLAGMLMQQAQGQGPGQELVRQQAATMGDRALAQQLAAARGARAGTGPAAFLGAAESGAMAQSRVGEQAAQAGLQAQLGAIDQLGGVLGQGRGQDIQRGGMNIEAQLQQMSLNDRQQAEMLRQRLLAAQLQQQGMMGYQGARLATPSMSERMLGALGGAGQAYMQMKAGQQPQGTLPQSTSRTLPAGYGTSNYAGLMV